jgi:hypothetical protein
MGRRRRWKQSRNSNGEKEKEKMGDEQWGGTQDGLMCCLVVDVLLHQQGTCLVNHLMTETGALMSVNPSFASIVKQIKQGQQHARGALRHHHYPSIHHYTHTTTHIDTPLSVSPSYPQSLTISTHCCWRTWVGIESFAIGSSLLIPTVATNFHRPLQKKHWRRNLELLKQNKFSNKLAKKFDVIASRGI